ncbi:MAG: hypothetical protein F6K00_30640 [Leptolyngbya sp. SIOISBB]|nr:hypothetical protein [Leptolyngbya sp. SIOISBB]
MVELHKLEDRIRDFINSPRKQSNLLEDSATWNKLCSALDLIGDTQIAIDAYPRLFNIQEEGVSYLIVYGILQTLLLQQDAAKHIGDALNFKVKLPKALEEIRVIRNSAAGHPSYQRENGLAKSCFITRMSISPTGFELMTVYSGDKEYEMRQISIPVLIEKQQSYLGQILSKVILELEKQEMKHREIHKDKKLADIFPRTINYHFGKIHEATYSRNGFPLGTPNLKIITECIENFKDELSIRGEWGVYESVDYHYELIDYPLKRLKAYFGGDETINEKDAYIYASFLSNQLKSLQGIAKELDEQYESAP